MRFAFWAGREFRLLLLMCLLVGFCAWVSAKLSIDAGGASAIWISNGLISAFILTAPPRWKAAFCFAGEVVNTGVDMAMGDPIFPALWMAFCSCSEVLIAVVPLQHFAARGDVTSRRAFYRITYFAVFLGPLTSALLGAPAISMQYGRPWPEVLRLWFLSSALGAAASLPLALLLLTRYPRRITTSETRIANVAWAVPLLIITLLVFWQSRYPILFLLFPPLIAVVFRFKLAGAVMGTSLVLILGAALTAEGHGPFTLFPGNMGQVGLFHIFGLILFVTCIPLGFAIEERYRLERELTDANRRLNDLVLLDGLTGVRNRRGFDALIEAEWLSACASQTDLSLLYLDIDFFKRFNDSYGHQSGDDCLRLVARTLARCVRKSDDCVARYGGEEFVIVLPQTPEISARITADRIAEAIQDLKIPHIDSPFEVVTVSVGMATASPRSGDDPAWLIHLADDALYEAKRRGRNRIEVSLGDSARECLLRPAM